MHYIKQQLAISMAVGLLMFIPISGEANSSLDARLARLERMIEHHISGGVVNKITELQDEILELRGKLEEREYEIADLKQQQQKFFDYLDKRLDNLYSNKNLATNNTYSNKTAPVAAANEQDLYNSAFKLMEQRQYSAAITAYQKYLWQYPQGKLAANAHYWLGELFLSQWQQDKTDSAIVKKAIDAFLTVTNNFPDHHKAEDALLKLGIVEIECDNLKQAANYLQLLKTNYPESKNLSLAEAKLQYITQKLN